MNSPKNRLPIGAFANLTRLSIKALRLYDQLDILRPSHIDQRSSYRYYDEEQLHRARIIRSLRDMDMPLATIRQVLEAWNSSPVQAETLVNAYVQARERQVEQIRMRVQDVIQLLQQEIKLMGLDVTVKKVAPQQVVSVTRRVKVDKLGHTITHTLDTIVHSLKEQNVKADGEPFGIYHGSINEEDDGPIEICLPVSAKIQAAGEMTLKQLEGGNAASVTLLGAQCDFPTILKGYDAVVDWIQSNGYETAESPREIWHSGPGKDAKMEVLWLFRNPPVGPVI
jgi:DNA-binding transcriptional MerR regulator